ncbi:MAG: glyceraldehyde-3-phosphate dehydrogenase [Deltaproteobacteria bacterium]|nr:glyceraldehyde-3-phosphate dehydrogenase [Deltaproteobacteria bacterium]
MNRRSDKSEATLREWTQQQRNAEAMVPIIGQLYREHGVIITVFGTSRVNKSPLEILTVHRLPRSNVDRDICVCDTYPIVAAMAELDLAPARIDVGNLTTHRRARGADVTVADFVRDELAGIATGKASIRPSPQDVVLYGFGRIGRLVARILAGKTGGGDNLRLRAIVVRPGGEDDLPKRASLLRRDSIHGPFSGEVQVDEANQALIINGNVVEVIYANSPEEIDYSKFGICDAIVIDNTGKWRTREELGEHVAVPGASKVILTAPGKDDVPNIVYGVNHHGMIESGNVLSAASCTTNAIAPVLKAVNDEFGIVSGHIESIHAFTNDQNLIDNYHRKARRGRAAPLNMVVTETGAAKAVAKCLPELAGKLTGNAIRVPTPNVSLGVMSLALRRSTTKQGMNEFLLRTSLEGDLQNQIDYVNSTEVVSSDFVGNRFAGIVDAQATIVDDTRAVLYVWYDNEFGYSRQVVRCLEELAGVVMPNFPKRVRIGEG